MIARSWIRLGLQENLHTAVLHVNVLAEYAGRGIGRALLMSRVSTDTPTGALSHDAESWNVARVRHITKTWKQAGLDSLVASDGDAQ
jgi:hypothetical protein